MMTNSLIGSMRLKFRFRFAAFNVLFGSIPFALVAMLYKDPAATYCELLVLSFLIGFIFPPKEI